MNQLMNEDDEELEVMMMMNDLLPLLRHEGVEVCNGERERIDGGQSQSLTFFYSHSVHWPAEIELYRNYYLSNHPHPPLLYLQHLLPAYNINDQ